MFFGRLADNCRCHMVRSDAFCDLLFAVCNGSSQIGLSSALVDHLSPFKFLDIPCTTLQVCRGTQLHLRLQGCGP